MRQSAIEGRGAFATSDVAAGEIVHLLDGQELSLVGCAWRIATRRLRWDDPLQIGPRRYIALDDVSVAFNHSCDPNCGMRSRSELFARRPIIAGEELTYDYSLTVRPGLLTRSWRLDCRCGADTCRTAVGNLSTVPSTLLAQYRAEGAIPDGVSDLVV